MCRHPAFDGHDGSTIAVMPDGGTAQPLSFEPHVARAAGMVGGAAAMAPLVGEVPVWVYTGGDGYACDLGTIGAGLLGLLLAWIAFLVIVVRVAIRHGRARVLLLLPLAVLMAPGQTESFPGPRIDLAGCGGPPVLVVLLLGLVGAAATYALTRGSSCSGGHGR